MPAKAKSVFICSECGTESPKWVGCCPTCGTWNSFSEEVRQPVTKSSLRSVPTSAASTSISNTAAHTERLANILPDRSHRSTTGINELDRVLGGGIVKGSIVLLGGEPGIGKSTLLLQICERLALTEQYDILYVSGEESSHQIKLRADRLGVSTDKLIIMQETELETIGQTISSLKPGIVMIDSIQTMNYGLISSAPGSLSQVRESTNYLMRLGKALDIPILIVGHVNKDGAIAGPKVLEHIVDAVLYFEGDRNLEYRILRAAKNRFGSTNEIGVFEMEACGLTEVENPSMMLISGRPKNTSGTCIACVMEGSRPILAEVQGLVTKTGFGNPRRMATGFDYNRSAMLLAVLEKRCGIYFSSYDTYVNVIGGLRLDEPAADLPVAMSLVSSIKDTVIPEGLVMFGEIGLGGELRSVRNPERRVAEAEKLGFDTCILPRHSLRTIDVSQHKNIELVGVRTVRETIGKIF